MASHEKRVRSEVQGRERHRQQRLGACEVEPESPGKSEQHRNHISVVGGDARKGVDRNDPFGDLARSMLGLFDALNVGKAHLLGNSLGGAAAPRLAIETPDRVDRLVLLGPGGIDSSRRPPTEGLLQL